MTEQEARARAAEIAAQSRLQPEDAAALSSLAARWAPLDSAALDSAAKESANSARALGQPWSPLLGARQLLVTLLREEALVESLPVEAREGYLAKLHGYEQPDSGRTVEQVFAEFEKGKAERAEAAKPGAREQAINELRQHPGLNDAKHPEHEKLVDQLVALHGD